MTADDVRDMLRERVTAVGSINALARAWQTTPAYISRVLSGRYPPGPTVLERLGISREHHYFKAER